MELAAARLYRAKWSEQIHDEWIRNVLKNREDLTAEQLGRIKDLMNAAVPDSTVEGYQNLVPALSLPDADDRHVLAAAIVSSSDAIVTFNLVDFLRRLFLNTISRFCTPMILFSTNLASTTRA
ncbi:PIN domain-containing protein [Rhizobium mongolense subsp. loessense]|uniref:PIN domain-containing protein n=1 Tax=Rhizobium mongolense subsp. loessense TaxID=158890 RepID=A0A1G4Q856_9HYPH|nr:PIN domain-containing protein [Rhizobium mongolense]SCW40631.1 PIN domain-containing protein [Rhizobium mongolense subsp. loessense]